MTSTPVDSSFFLNNRAQLTRQIEQNHLVILHSNDPMPTNADGIMGFQQNSDLFYFTGIDQEETSLILNPQAANPIDREILFIKKTSPTIAIWEGRKLSKEQAAKISGIKRIEWSETFEKITQNLATKAKGVYLLQNEHARNQSKVINQNERCSQAFNKAHPNIPTQRLAPLTAELRMVKSPIEIEQISRACSITEKGFLRILPYIQPGKGEWEVQAELIHEFTRHQSKGFAYQPIIASGADSCILHYTSNNKIMQDGDLVLLDVAAEWNNWNSDLTRTVPVNGRFSKRQKAVYNEVLSIMTIAKNDLLTPGKNIKNYQTEVIELMSESLQKLNLITSTDIKEKGLNQAVRKYFMHGTSHHLGLDVHDVHSPDFTIQKNMVFTVEPGIYIPEEGFGIRLENDIVVKKGNNLDLMATIPIQADEIEELMNA